MSKYYKAYEAGKAAWKALTTKKSPTITSVKIAPHITTKRAIQDKVVEAVDSGVKKANVPPSVKASLKVKQSASKSKVKESKKLKGLSYKWDKLVSKQKKDLKETKNLIKASGATAVAGAGAAGVSVYNKKKKKD